MDSAQVASLRMFESFPFSPLEMTDGLNLGLGSVALMTGGIRLPHEFYHFWIIPRLLSRYLHLLIVEGKREEWCPFVILPLVSREFNQSYKSHLLNMFDIQEGDGAIAIVPQLYDALSLWGEASINPLGLNIPGIYGAVHSGLTYSELTSKKSLMQIYICAAQAKFFFNVDVMRPIYRESYFLRTGIHTEGEGWDAPFKIKMSNGQIHYTRQYKMVEDMDHRSHRALQAAADLCDRVPEELVTYAAEYLAGQIPIHISLSNILRISQGLEMTLVEMTDRHLDKSIALDLINHELVQIENIKEIVSQAYKASPTVETFSGDKHAPPELIRATHILEVLNAVALVDWGDKTVEMRELLEVIREELEEGG